MFLRAGPFQVNDDCTQTTTTTIQTNQTKHLFITFALSFTVPFVGGRSLLAIYTLGPTWPYLCVVSGALKGIDAYIGLIHTGGLLQAPFPMKKWEIVW